MKPYILFAIRNPEAKRQRGLAKAIQVARALGASLELFHALTDEVIVELARDWNDDFDSLRERIEGEARIPLVRMCAAARRHGVEAAHSVTWDYPAHEAVVRRATAIGASLIVVECHEGVHTHPWLMRFTDWELLRTSPLPVLLLKSGKPYLRPLVLAAVDPAHVHAKPLELDAGIVSQAGDLARGLRGALHVMHANFPTIVGPSVDAAASKAARSWSTFSFEDLQEQEREAFETFRTSAGVPRRRAHLVDGNPAVAIPRLAGELGADILAMGALSRSGLERLFIGNTAERILDAVRCDVLVIKPRSFVTPVPPRMRSERAAANSGPAPMYS